MAWFVQHFDFVPRGLCGTRRVCGKFVLRSQPTSPHSNTLSQTYICSDRELEALAGGQQIADLTARYHIVLPKFIWNNGYMNVTANAPRPLAQNEVGRELAQKTFESELRCLYACFTYLGYGTLPQHKVAALAASTLKKDPPA